jgi:CRISPR/Cas system endoribonuclease Cas6 (RAMP superfamily)
MAKEYKIIAELLQRGDAKTFGEAKLEVYSEHLDKIEKLSITENIKNYYDSLLPEVIKRYNLIKYQKTRETEEEKITRQERLAKTRLRLEAILEAGVAQKDQLERLKENPAQLESFYTKIFKPEINRIYHTRLARCN